MWWKTLTFGQEILQLNSICQNIAVILKIVWLNLFALQYESIYSDLLFNEMNEKFSDQYF